MEPLAAENTFAVSFIPDNDAAPLGIYEITGTTLTMDFTEDEPPGIWFRTGTFTNKTTLVCSEITFHKIQDLKTHLMQNQIYSSVC